MVFKVGIYPSLSLSLSLHVCSHTMTLIFHRLTNKIPLLRTTTSSSFIYHSLVPEAEDGHSEKPDKAEYSRPAGHWCPEETAGPINVTFFNFVGSLVRLGYNKSLNQEDLWDTAADDRAEFIGGRFEGQLEASQGALWRAVVKSHGRVFFMAGLVKLFHDIVMFLGPFLLQVLLKNLQEGGPSSRGLLLAGGLALASVAETLSINIYFHMIFRICLHMKIGLVNALYKKSLRISASARTRLGAGTIVNLQSNDAAKIWELPKYLHMLWSAPFQILAVMALLARVITPLPALAGLVVTILLIPASAAVARVLGRVRKRLMECTDSRVKLCTEIILGIKAIKLYAWEQAYKQRILNIRSDELREIRKSSLLSTINNMVFIGGPILISMAAFVCYSLLGHPLTASVAFPALALFNLLRFPVMMLPSQISTMINGKVALDRVQKFLDADEMIIAPLQAAAPPGGVAVRVSAADFAWDVEDHETPPLLQNINLSIERGSLVVIVGAVGAGKSSLLSALLGEMAVRRGSVSLMGKTSYTAQDSWIRNDTIRGNILLGEEYDPIKYAAAVETAALNLDLDALPAKDRTEIGEKGVNLSGGQRARVALARAAYAGADIVLLDDPLSAVDAHVGRHIFSKCIKGLMGDATRILVTHQLQFLPEADTVLVMEGGKITEEGTYTELIQKGIDFHQLAIESEDEDAQGKNDVEDSAENLHMLASSRTIKVVDEDICATIETAGAVASEAQHDSARRRVSLDGAEGGVEPDGKLTTAEDRAVGQVDKAIYRNYFASWGPLFLVPLSVLMLAMGERGLQAGQNWWLSIWSSATESSAEGQVPPFYMWTYFGIGLLSLILQSVKAVVLVLGSVTAAQSLHAALLDTVLRLPMAFFDSNPTGRLLNRFTKDTEAVDVSLSSSVSSFLNCAVSILWSLAVVIVVSPGIIFALVPLSISYGWIQNRYIATSRELKRLDSVALSPIFGHFGETLTGLASVRAFRRQEPFQKQNTDLLDESNRAWWPAQCVNRWLSVRLELLGVAVVFGTAVFVSTIMPTSAGLAGLALTSALNLTGLLNWAVRMTTELEVNMNSCERVMEYRSQPQEAAHIVYENRPLPDWPFHGEIRVESLVLRYRPHLPPVLNGVTFHVRPHEKIGICGRTGAGKSSLLMALFRIVEASGGRIGIDGINIATIGLFDLRSRLSLVPQDPVLFSGTVRTNLDPFGNAESDEHIWHALKRSGLSGVIQALPGGLDAGVSEGGANLSVGQRQLVCMARALLRSSRVLVCDEATSNVDTATDALIQKAIASSFGDCTVLTIAHRLHTILDSDRVLVMDAGKVAEYDTPNALMRVQGGIFKSLVDEASMGK